MPAEQDNTTSTIVPAGHRIVSEEDYIRMASAGNDLKKLKSGIPEGFDITQLSTILSKVEEYDKSKKTEIENLTGELSKKETKLQELKSVVDSMKKQTEQLSIKSDVEEMLREKAADGGYVTNEFIDWAGCAVLDRTSATYKDDLNKVLSKSWERQEEFLKRMGITPNISPIVDAVGKKVELDPDVQSQGIISQLGSGINWRNWMTPTK